MLGWNEERGREEVVVGWFAGQVVLRADDREQVRTGGSARLAGDVEPVQPVRSGALAEDDDARSQRLDLLAAVVVEPARQRLAVAIGRQLLKSSIPADRVRQ